MEFYGLDKTTTIDNCDSVALGRVDRDAAALSGWNRARPEHVVDLLDRAAAEARGDARNLATLLSRMSWRIHSVAQAPGGGNRLVSNVRDITVSVAGRVFQLHCTESPLLKLERITAA